MPAPPPANVTDTPDNVTHIRQLANKWRRQVTNAELLEIIDHVLGETECPRCRDARLANRSRQAKYRAAHKQ